MNLYLLQFGRQGCIKDNRTKPSHPSLLALQPGGAGARQLLSILTLAKTALGDLRARVVLCRGVAPARRRNGRRC